MAAFQPNQKHAFAGANSKFLDFLEGAGDGAALSDNETPSTGTTSYTCVRACASTLDSCTNERSSAEIIATGGATTYLELQAFK